MQSKPLTSEEYLETIKDQLGDIIELIKDTNKILRKVINE